MERSRSGEGAAALLCETLRVDRIERFGHLTEVRRPQLCAVVTALSSAPSVARRSDFLERVFGGLVFFNIFP